MPENEDFYSHLKMEDVTDADYTYSKIVCKYFELKNIGECHDLKTSEICVLKYMKFALLVFLLNLD